MTIRIPDEITPARLGHQPRRHPSGAEQPAGLCVIDPASDAGEYLRWCLNEPDTTQVTIEVRDGGMAIKRNENTWSSTMRTTRGR